MLDCKSTTDYFQLHFRWRWNVSSSSVHALQEEIESQVRVPFPETQNEGEQIIKLHFDGLEQDCSALVMELL